MSKHWHTSEWNEKEKRLSKCLSDLHVLWITIEPEFWISFKFKIDFPSKDMVKYYNWLKKREIYLCETATATLESLCFTSTHAHINEKKVTGYTRKLLNDKLNTQCTLAQPTFFGTKNMNVYFLGQVFCVVYESNREKKHQHPSNLCQTLYPN